MATIFGRVKLLTNSPNQSVVVALPINGGSITLSLRIYYNEGF
jgi:hypothetical protein